MKKILIILGVVLVIFVVSVLIIGRTFYPDNIAKTSPDGGAKGLKTRFYQTDLETARKTVTEVVQNLTTYGSSWKIVNDKTQTVNTITAEVPVIVFTDDLTVKINETEKEGEVKIDVESKSRVGKSDFGENARHVRKVLNSLDEKLAK
jgi:uncharacterized protein (DUF1499 family)